MKQIIILSFFFLFTLSFSLKSQDKVHVIGSDSSYQMIMSGRAIYSIYDDSVLVTKPKPQYDGTRGRRPEIMHCDFASFEILSSGYAKDKNHIYYNGEPLIEVDYESFEVIEVVTSILQKFSISSHFFDYYAKDKKHVYYGKNIVIDADPLSIEWISPIFTKDKKHVFIRDIILKDADVNSFEILEGNFTKDNKYVYFSGKAVSNNPESFEIVDYEFRYAKDKDYAYFWWGLCRSHEIDTIKDVNAENFRVLTDFRATDGEKVFWFGYLMADADVESFKVINHQYSCDNTNVYCGSKLIDDANPETFELIEKAYTKDDKAVFHAESILKKADPKTFIVLGYQWGKDKDCIYFRNERREDIDYKSFEYDPVVKDKNYIYNYSGKIIKENK